MDIWPVNKPNHAAVRFYTVEEKHIFDQFVPNFICLEYWHNLKDNIVGVDNRYQQFPVVRNISNRTLYRTLGNLETSLDYQAADRAKIELAIALKRQIGGYFLEKRLTEHRFD